MDTDEEFYTVITQIIICILITIPFKNNEP